MDTDNQFLGYILYDYHLGYLASYTELEKNRYLTNLTDNLSEAYVFNNLYPICKFLKKTGDAIDYKGFILLRLFKQEDTCFSLPPLMSELRKVPVTEEASFLSIENYQTTEEMLKIL